MLITGLTGGIATGKSTVARLFQRSGAFVIDADRIAREVVAPGQPAWQAVRELFGEGILLGDGKINRSRLGQIVFKEAHLRRQLEKIIHPRVRGRIAAQIDDLRRRVPDALVIQDVPLLLEKQLEKGLDEIIVVYAPVALQLQRLMQRDGFSRHEALFRIQAQMPIEDKRRLATIVIDNSGTLENTEQQVLQVYAALLRKADKAQNRRE